jgi:hypothetical protein
MTNEFDLSGAPSDPTAAIGYAELYALWKENMDAFNHGRDISKADFQIWIDRVRKHLIPMELAFFDEPFDERNFSKVEVKKVSNLYKILFDRHGARVSKEGGGLG